MSCVLLNYPWPIMQYRLCFSYQVQKQTTLGEQKMANPPTPKQDPNQFAQPTAEQEQVPYEQQPVQQQYFSQPNAAPVQYVVSQQSLKGMRGWLLFFVLVSGLAAIAYVGLMVDTYASFSSDKTADAIFLPILIASSLATVILTAMSKKIAKFAFMAFYAVAYVYQIISVALGDKVDGAELVSSILIGGIWLLFIVLYFLNSKRVKETLVK